MTKASPLTDPKRKRDDCCDLPDDLAHVTPAYRRALWIVVVLNAGYGIIEMIGGFVAGSQALKADALDFLGDGSITLLGLVAIGWSIAWRARSALIQGIFLGAMGVSVLGNTVYRVLVLQTPQADLMGIFGVIALAINVSAAVALLPHRDGDANVRAVWLFSRNDALGNLAVVVAAGLVWWTHESWPDLVAATAIALLFLQSSWSIIGDARRDPHPAATHTTATTRPSGAYSDGFGPSRRDAYALARKLDGNDQRTSGHVQPIGHFVVRDSLRSASLKLRSGTLGQAGAPRDFVVNGSTRQWTRDLSGASCKATAVLSTATPREPEVMNGKLVCKYGESTFTLHKKTGTRPLC